MKVYRDFTAAEIEAQYNLRAGRPDYETAVVPDWIERSARARVCLNCTLDVVYGQGTKQKLDIFRSGDSGAQTLIYFHGGYWQRGDKSVYSFLAEPFNRHNVNVIIVGYDLCPTVSITRISDEAREALTFVWRNATELGVSRDRLTVMGHSAGGHITAMMMGTNWPKWASDLPRDLVKAGIPVSPLNDLEPLRFTSLNDGVRMDAAEAQSQSPLNSPPVTNAPQLVVVGERESDEFHRQANVYVSAFANAQRPIERYTVPDSDHFDELNVLADDGSPFFAKTIGMMKKQ